MRKSFKIFNKEIVFDLRSDADLSVFDEVFVNRDYRILDEIIKAAKGYIVDIGAHIGCFSIYASLLNSGVKIYAYEPEVENFSALKENLKNNHLENVFPKNLAVAGKEGSQILYISPDSHNHSLVNLPGGLGEKKVESTTLDKIISAKGECDLVKMDCEGAEFEILASMSKESFAKIRNFYIEYHEYLPEMRKDDLKRILKMHNFKVKTSPSHYDKRMGFVFAQRKDLFT